ncbi:MAG: response regulator [Candidatus Eisenbacteria bacterium]|uniref:Response regulator n=1 Tax=Eiseniibacteriota bacterium TaxID=2212470 RepID=A0A538SJJ6_UNCEI|nr:MAG: response regulator [Candidatus Eisenbacteria bacterium]TMQ57840.1 MAG: response regulator [Candidatus Eisenbacteria bacterium]
MHLRVLVVEDDPDSLELMIYLFRAFGHEALGAASGDTALGVAAAATPDLILCDLRLPGMDGFELLSRFKADPGTRSIPVVAVTAYAMPGDRERVMGAGFDGYVSKPIDPQSFVREAEALSARR